MYVYLKVDLSQNFHGRNIKVRLFVGEKKLSKDVETITQILNLDFTFSNFSSVNIMG